MHDEDFDVPPLPGRFVDRLRATGWPSHDLEQRTVAAAINARIVDPSRARAGTLRYAAVAAGAVIVFGLGYFSGSIRPVREAPNNADAIRAAGASYFTALSHATPTDTNAVRAAIDTYRAASVILTEIAPESSLSGAVRVALRQSVYSPNAAANGQGGFIQWY